MARYSGLIGYVFEQIEDPDRPGIMIDNIVEKKAFGDILDRSYRWSSSNGTLDDGRAAITITIVANEFVTNHWNKIKYAMWHGQPFKVENVRPGHPRITLSLGGVYNGKTASGIERDIL